MKLQIYKHWNGGYVAQCNGCNIVGVRRTKLDVTRFFRNIRLVRAYRDIYNKIKFNIVSSDATAGESYIDKSNYTVAVLFTSLILM